MTVKKKKGKNRGLTLLLLLFVMLLFGSLSYIAVKKNNETESTESDTGETEAAKVDVTDFELSQVTEITYKNSDNVSITFVLEGENWIYPENMDFPVNSTSVRTMISNLCELTSEKAFEQQNLSDYGLSPALYSVNIKAGKEYTLSIGNETSLGGEVYVMNGDGKIYLCDSACATYLKKGLEGFIEKEEVPELTSLYEVKIVSGEESIDFLYDSEKTYSDNAVSLIDKLTSFYFGSCIKYNPTEDDLVSYGLMEPEKKITVFYTDGQENKEFTFEIGAPEDSDTKYVRISGSALVYELYSSFYTAFTAFTTEDCNPVTAAE